MGWWRGGGGSGGSSGRREGFVRGSGVGETCWNGFSAALIVHSFLPPMLFVEPLVGPRAGTAQEAESIARDRTGGSFLSPTAQSAGEEITQINKKTFQMDTF